MNDNSSYIIYVDESGDHKMDKVTNDYPVFVLAFCIFSFEDYINSAVPKLLNFKFNYFHNDTIILHENEMRNAKPPFHFLTKKERREIFYKELGNIIKTSSFKVIASVIKKLDHKNTYHDPSNPYEIALLFCLERLYMYMQDLNQNNKKSFVVFESRGNKEDRDLELEFRRICDGNNMLGTNFPFEIIFQKKLANTPGLQIADLIARPIGRHVIKPAQENKAYEIIKSKFRQGPSGQISGWGLKIFP